MISPEPTLYEVGETLKACPLNSGTKQSCLFSTLISCNIQNHSQSHQTRIKEIKKKSDYPDLPMVLYSQNPKDYQKPITCSKHFMQCDSIKLT